MASQVKPANLNYECSDAEWQARLDLAACYRIFDHLGWGESIYNHISVAVPGEEGNFLINPFGLMYDEVTASNLVKIDVEGNNVGGSPYMVNKAGFTQHVAQGSEHVLHGGESLLPVDDVVALHTQQAQLLLRLQHHGTHEVRHRLVVLNARFGLVADVFPQRPPLLLAVPHVGPLVEGHAVLAAVLVDLLDGDGG